MWLSFGVWRAPVSKEATYLEFESVLKAPITPPQVRSYSVPTLRIKCWDIATINRPNWPGNWAQSPSTCSNFDNGNILGEYAVYGLNRYSYATWSAASSVVEVGLGVVLVCYVAYRHTADHAAVPLNFHTMKHHLCINQT